MPPRRKKAAEKAKELGLTPLARIVSTGVTGLSPEIMGLGPIEAVKKALANAKMSISDIDLYEINEAFAVQVLGSAGWLSCQPPPIMASAYWPGELLGERTGEPGGVLPGVCCCVKRSHKLAGVWAPGFWGGGRTMSVGYCPAICWA